MVFLSQNSPKSVENNYDTFAIKENQLLAKNKSGSSREAIMMLFNPKKLFSTVFPFILLTSDDTSGNKLSLTLENGQVIRYALAARKDSHLNPSIPFRLRREFLNVAQIFSIDQEYSPLVPEPLVDLTLTGLPGLGIYSRRQLAWLFHPTTTFFCSLMTRADRVIELPNSLIGCFKHEYQEMSRKG